MSYTSQENESPKTQMFLKPQRNGKDVEKNNTHLTPSQGVNTIDTSGYFEAPSLQEIEENRQQNIQDLNFHKPGEKTPGQQQKNNTGLPDQVKAGIEQLSGMSLDHVKVHYNSDKPAKLNAHAYAQGSNIHMAPGQERHIAHEAWHVVQQAQGRVAPTSQVSGEAVNDNPSLEHEADVMGEKALQLKIVKNIISPVPNSVPNMNNGTQDPRFIDKQSEIMVQQTELNTSNLSTAIPQVQQYQLTPIQKNSQDVRRDLTNNKYPRLKNWHTNLVEAVTNPGVSKALPNLVTCIICSVAEKDESIRRGVYDDLRKLLNRYNNNQIRYRIDLSLVPTLPAREIETTSEYLCCPDSPTREEMTQQEALINFNHIFDSAPQITLEDQRGNGQIIPVLDNFAQAGRAIRYQQYAQQTINPIPFTVQQGDLFTLFEYRQDYVANPLIQQGDAYRRDGQIGSWAQLIKLIDSTTTIQDIINIINGNVTTQATQIQLEVAGAMIADNKNGIQNWITVMNGLPLNTPIKKLLETEYQGFVNSRSYQTSNPQTGPNTSLGIPDYMDLE